MKEFDPEDQLKWRIYRLDENKELIQMDAVVRTRMMRKLAKKRPDLHFLPIRKEKR